MSFPLLRMSFLIVLFWKTTRGPWRLYPKTPPQSLSGANMVCIFLRILSSCKHLNPRASPSELFCSNPSGPNAGPCRPCRPCTKPLQEAFVHQRGNAPNRTLLQFRPWPCGGSSGQVKRLRKAIRLSGPSWVSQEPPSLRTPRPFSFFS